MKRWRKILVVAISVAVLMAAILLGYAYHALHQVQPFYQAAIEADAQTLQTASRQMESRVVALAGDAQQAAQWQALFTDTEVNGWLAVALKEKFPKLLPRGVSKPRVAFEENRLLAGLRYQDDRLDTIVSVEAQLFMTDTDVLAIRLEGAHAGTLPIPLEKIMKLGRQAASRQGIALRWTWQEGVPVALVRVGDLLSTDSEHRQLEIVELRNGELFVAGSTEEPDPMAE